MSPFHIDVSKLPSIENPWGPSAVTPDALQFNGVPYAPFIKTDKLGKIADWNSVKEEEQLPGKNNNLQKRRDVYHAYGASAAKLFGAETEEKGFSLVENTASSGNKQAVLNGHRNRQFQNQTGKKTTSTSTPATQASALKKKVGSAAPTKKQPITKNAAKWGGNNKWGNNRWANDEAKLKESSINVEEDWESVAEIEFNKLTKLNLEVPKSETLSTNGTIHQYLKKYENNTATPLEPVFQSTYNQTSSDDSILKNYAKTDSAKVFITDAIIAQLMCTPRASASWDIIVTKKNGKIFFDKRPNTFNLPVNENSSPVEVKESDINHPAKLELEDIETSNSFISGSLAKNSSKFSDISPVTLSSAIPKGYKYVKFNLPNGTSTDDDSQGSVPIIVRVSLDAYTYTASSNLALHSLLQYESNDWRTRFNGGAQGNIFVDEVKKNNNKLSQWATECVLGGINQIKLGFITRADPKSNASHLVAGTMTSTIDILCQQLKLSINNGWGIVKSFIDIIEHEGGDNDYRFVIFKTPNSQKVIIYKVPFDSFDF
ncbi:hypothetical protein C6P40_003865 [Pichia californica]|uniref:Eukaryotic translation initiation factor 3 subunit D n=1 Tax=Pichia californica TaxID=460514 RepID=A0A9P6WN12_9ASCO|nr:hypothetical protein C6P42_004355 [[Candida] californica]KAG0690102.1 hypothetical protein C6P40_003865 [[Candida] californica]